MRPFLHFQLFYCFGIGKKLPFLVFAARLFCIFFLSDDNFLFRFPSRGILIHSIPRSSIALRRCAGTSISYGSLIVIEEPETKRRRNGKEPRRKNVERMSWFLAQLLLLFLELQSQQKSSQLRIARRSSQTVSYVPTKRLLRFPFAERRLVETARQ